MTIPEKDWRAYIDRLSKINEKAADLMRTAVRVHGYGDMTALINYAWSISTSYGEAAAALSAEMYDAIAAASGITLPAAEVAETAAYSEVARTVQGVAKQSQNENMMAGAVERLVKRAGADTMLKNAERDGAEFAWVPSGDTCAFCITLASRGWQRQSRKAMKNGHAEHIHANCDCQYAVRFSDKDNVAGYDPEEYRRMYENAPLDEWNTPDGRPPEGDAGAERNTPKNRINAIRRAQYAEEKDKINAQKRAAYAERTGKKQAENNNYTDITGNWYPESKPNSHMVQDLKEYKAADGRRFSVDGINVVLDYTPYEKEIAELLEREIGGELYMVPRVNKPEGVKTPDYLFHGKAYDLKTPKKNASQNAIFKRIKKASGQAHGIILDVSRSGLSDDVIAQQMDKVFWSKDTEFVDEVAIIKDGKISRVLKRI